MNCTGCGSLLTKRHQKTQCSNRCQRASERAADTARWLSPGRGTPGTHHGHYIREYLLQDQAGLCAICCCPPTGHGLPLRFVLDHVDGDATDNHRDNLRLVCPNCDSQLPTYKARNRGRGRARRRQRYIDGKSY